ncbi:MAG TPA: hypothetical protein VIM65_21585 [Cyclobacteriaceae bacterium]
MISKLIFLISSIAWFNVNTNIDGSVDDRTMLLASASSKSWYIYSTTPETDHPTCLSTHAISIDNTYTFYANGTFEFDHGTVTESPGCTSDECCSDLVNFTGTWKFTNNQNSIVITGLAEKGNPANKFNLELYNGAISQLDDAVLKFTQRDPETNILHTIEFRKR